MLSIFILHNAFSALPYGLLFIDDKSLGCALRSIHNRTKYCQRYAYHIPYRANILYTLVRMDYSKVHACSHLLHPQVVSSETLTDKERLRAESVEKESASEVDSEIEVPFRFHFYFRFRFRLRCVLLFAKLVISWKKFDKLNFSHHTRPTRVYKHI